MGSTFITRCALFLCAISSISNASVRAYGTGISSGIIVCALTACALEDCTSHVKIATLGRTLWLCCAPIISSCITIPVIRLISVNKKDKEDDAPLARDATLAAIFIGSFFVLFKYKPYIETTGYSSFTNQLMSAFIGSALTIPSILMMASVRV